MVLSITYKANVNLPENRRVALVIILTLAVLVSLSYLLDFLIAVDFLGCERIKASVEDKIREKIDETNWREILSYTKDIIGLENTTKAALEHVMKALAKYYHDTDLSKEPANEVGLQMIHRFSLSCFY